MNICQLKILTSAFSRKQTNRETSDNIWPKMAFFISSKHAPTGCLGDWGRGTWRNGFIFLIITFCSHLTSLMPHIPEKQQTENLSSMLFDSYFKLLGLSLIWSFVHDSFYIELSLRRAPTQWKQYHTGHGDATRAGARQPQCPFCLLGNIALG